MRRIKIAAPQQNSRFRSFASDKLALNRNRVFAAVGLNHQDAGLSANSLRLQDWPLLDKELIIGHCIEGARFALLPC